MQKLFASLLIIFLFIACRDEGPYPGYSIHDNAIHYKLLAFEADDLAIALGEGEILNVNFTVNTMRDSLLYNSRYHDITGSYYLLYVKDSLPTAIYSLLGKVNMGDSLSLILGQAIVNAAFFKKSGGMIGFDTLKLNIRLINRFTPEEYAFRLMEVDQLKEDLDIEEQRVLRKYLTENEINIGPISSGYYYMPDREGMGDAVEYGKYVELSYKGYFLDGMIFDSTRHDWPFDLVIGDQYQLIKGLEDGITLMKEGGKAKFIIPSQLAFGATGSSTGIVPPYTTVLYEVEILKVN